MSILRTPFINQFRSDRFLKILPKYVTVFGSAQKIFNDDQHPYSVLARSLTSTLAQHGHTVMTGGGPGLMMQSNKGAYNVDPSKSVGCSIDIFTEQTNAYMSSCFKAFSLSLRKRVLIENAQCFVCLPGGYGTLDEFFEVLTLVKINHLKDKPKVFLLGKPFWQPLNLFIQSAMNHHVITDEEATLFEVVDSIDPILNHVSIQTLADVETI